MAVYAFNPDEIILFRPEYEGNRDSSMPCVVTLQLRMGMVKESLN